MFILIFSSIPLPQQTSCQSDRSLIQGIFTHLGDFLSLSWLSLHFFPCFPPSSCPQLVYTSTTGCQGKSKAEKCKTVHCQLWP